MRNFILSTGLISLLITSVQAQELSLKQAWEYALKHNPTMASVGYDEAIAAKNLDIAKAAYRPQVHLNMDYRKIDGDRAGFYQGMMPEKKGSFNAKINQKLFSLDTNTQIEKAKISQTLANLHLDSTRMDLAYAIGTSAVDIAYAQVALGIYKERAKRISAYLNMANDKYKAGTIDLGDVYRWESELSKIKSTIQEANNTIVTNKSMLKNYLGMSQSEVIDISLTQGDIEAFANINKDDVIANPKIEMLKENIKSDGIEANNIERSFYVPEFSLYGSTEEMLYKGGDGSQLPSSQNWNTYTVGVEVNFPLYEGGAKQAKKEALRVKQLQTQSDIQSFEDELSKEQESAISSINAYQESFKLDTVSADKAMKYLLTKHQQYQEGATDITPLLDAEEYATLAELKVEQTKYLIMRYKLMFAYALNKLQNPFGSSDSKHDLFN